MEESLYMIDEASLLTSEDDATFKDAYLKIRLMQLKLDLLIKAKRELQPKFNTPTEILFINGDKRKIISLI